MRARYPDRTGVVSRGEVDIHYEVYGEGEPSLVLIPPSPITHSRIYKGLVPHLSRSHRIVAIDGRGNGHSGRPPGVGAYRRSENVADIVAVMKRPTFGKRYSWRTVTPTGGRWRSPPDAGTG